MQFTANNIDINHSLLGGKDTFHASQVPGWQRGPNETKHLASLKPADRTALVIPEALCSNCRQLIYRGRQKCSGIYRTYWTEVLYCFYTFVWRQAYFPETSASEPKGDRLGASWRSTGPCLYDTQFKLGRFFGLVSFWCTTGWATLLGKCRRSHFVCTGQCGCTKVDANCCIKRCYNSLTLTKK